MHRNAHIQPQMQVTATCASSSEVTTTAAQKRARATQRMKLGFLFSFKSMNCGSEPSYRATQEQQTSLGRYRALKPALHMVVISLHSTPASTHTLGQY